MLARSVEVDEVRDRERQLQRDGVGAVALPAASGDHSPDDGVPAHAAEREELFEGGVRLAVDDLGAVAPAEPALASSDRVDAEAAQKWDVTPAGLSSAEVSDQE